MTATGGPEAAVPAIDQAAERAVHGGIVTLATAEHVRFLVARGLRPEHFYWSQYGTLFEIAVQAAERGEAIDSITLSAELRRRLQSPRPTAAQIEELATFVPVAGHYAEYADRVIELAEWRSRQRALYALSHAVETRSADEWVATLAELGPVAKSEPKRSPNGADPGPIRGPLRLVVNGETGEVIEPDRACENCRALEDQLDGAQREIRGWRSRYAQLSREAEASAQKSEWWPQARALFKVWRESTGHIRSKWTYDRFHECEALLRVYRIEVCERAVAGIAFDPFVTVRKNGSKYRHDGWELVFRSAAKLEEYANKAPRDWMPTIRKEDYAQPITADDLVLGAVS